MPAERRLSSFDKAENLKFWNGQMKDHESLKIAEVGLKKDERLRSDSRVRLEDENAQKQEILKREMQKLYGKELKE